MNDTYTFPAFDDCLSDLNQFILDLVSLYEAGKLRSWGDLEEQVNAFFTPEKMEQMESRVPGWQKMVAYKSGVTLTHVTGVFLGLFMLPEFKSLSAERRQLAKWTVLFHDLEKEFTGGAGEKDKTHAFRSAVTTARRLPPLGFAIAPEYEREFGPWSRLVLSAIKTSTDSFGTVQDNTKLPVILTGIEKMFGAGTPGALIVKAVLLHMSINVVIEWPQAAPLTDVEIQSYMDGELLPLLKVMMLADNEGWVLFYPEREEQRQNTLDAFEKIEKRISGISL
jgi:hypothetical protein